MPADSHACTRVCAYAGSPLPLDQQLCWAWQLQDILAVPDM